MRTLKVGLWVLNVGNIKAIQSNFYLSHDRFSEIISKIFGPPTLNDLIEHTTVRKLSVKTWRTVCIPTLHFKCTLTGLFDPKPLLKPVRLKPLNWKNIFLISFIISQSITFHKLVMKPTLLLNTDFLLSVNINFGILENLWNYVNIIEKN